MGGCARKSLRKMIIFTYRTIEFLILIKQFHVTSISGYKANEHHEFLLGGLLGNQVLQRHSETGPYEGDSPDL